MRKAQHLLPSDLRGLGRLGVDAVQGIVALVESLHQTIAQTPGVFGQSPTTRTTGVTGFVYRCLRGTTRLVGGGLDTALTLAGRLIKEAPSSSTRDALVAALNGVLGDYLLNSANPLALPMRLRAAGRYLQLDRASLIEQFPSASPKLIVFIHGLCMNDLHWQATSDLTQAPAKKFAESLGCTPLFLHYNSGLHISSNGEALCDLLEQLVRAWPVAVHQITLVGHSMGGLVIRSACHHGGQGQAAWLSLLGDLVFLGTPHNGAPLERGGNWIDTALGLSPYSAPFARLGKLRSAGITDLRHGYLLREDWQGRDRFARGSHRHKSVPLPQGVACYAVAGCLGDRAIARRSRWLGDGLVPVESALGLNDNPAYALSLPPDKQWVAESVGHLELMTAPSVFAQLARWLGPARESARVAATRVKRQ